MSLKKTMTKRKKIATKNRSMTRENNEILKNSMIKTTS
jgi:hypothetical protein